MYDRRDEAIVRLMVETGARAGEVVALTPDAVKLAEGTVLERHLTPFAARRSDQRPRQPAALHASTTTMSTHENSSLSAHR